MTQQVINVGAAPNDGAGDPIRTAYIKCNDNFDELFSRNQVSPPATLVGSIGDQAGMYAYDPTYFYYCYADYDGSSVIWGQLVQAGNISATQLLYGNTVVDILGPSGNVEITIDGTGNVAYFDATGVTIGGELVSTGNATVANIQTAGSILANGNITGNYIFGNGSQLSGLPETYANSNVAAYLPTYSGNLAGQLISVVGNVTAGNLRSSGLVSTTGNIVTTNSIFGNNLTATNIFVSTVESTDSSPITFIPSAIFSSDVEIQNDAVVGRDLLVTNNINSANLTTSGSVSANGAISAAGNIVTDGYFIGTFVGNVTGNFVVPGSNTQILFNTNGNADAAAALTFNSASNTLTVLGPATVSGNVTGGNVLTGGLISSTGNVTGANLITGGLILATGNITGGNIRTGGLISVAGNVTGNTFIGNNIALNGNIQTGGIISAAGNITGGNIVTTGSFQAASYSASGNIVANNFISNQTITATGNITGANLTSSGRVLATGNITGGNITTGAQVVALGNITGANLVTTGAIFANSVIFTTGNITGGNLVTGGSANITGSITSAANITGSNLITSGLITATGNLTSGNISTAGLITATGNLTSGNISTAGLITATGNINGGNLIISGAITAAGNISGSYITGNGSQLTGVLATDVGVLALLSVTGNTTTGNLSTGGRVSAAGNIIGANLNLSSGTLVVGNIVNNNSNGVGNIGSSTTYFNTVFAKATSAQYADIAECYLSDAEYAPGTVVEFGGIHEVTQCNTDMCAGVAGVISTNPAYQMNSGLQGAFVATVALLGRVPCRVQGPVKKGSLMVSAGNGSARAETSPVTGAVIGKAVESFDGIEGTIEIVVGRL
jgi:filamentous hemagglutinin